MTPQLRLLVPVFCLALVASLSAQEPAQGPGQSSAASSPRESVIFKPSDHIKVHEPGKQEENEGARQLSARAQKEEQEGNLRGAVNLYQRLVKRYSRDVLSPEAAFKVGELQEKRKDYSRAAQAYRVVMEIYPHSPRFAEAMEGQFRIGEMFLNGERVRFLGIPTVKSLERALEIFAAVVRAAPYGKYTARAQFNIGLVREKQGQKDLAVAAYQAVVDKFPDEPIAADAQYQLGYLWYDAARAGTKDSAAVTSAKTGFEDFLYRYPKSEKAAQAKENLARLENKETKDTFGIARFYDKQKNYRAAVIYYNDVIKQMPGSPQSAQAQKRIAEITAKVGPEALKIPVVPGAGKKKELASSRRSRSDRGSESADDVPEMRANPNDVAPLPPPEEDEALPPAASIEPMDTLAPPVDPGSSPAPESESAPESQPSPSPSE